MYYDYRCKNLRTLNKIVSEARQGNVSLQMTNGSIRLHLDHFQL